MCSGVNTPKEIARTYERVKDCKVDVVFCGSVGELREQAMRARREECVKNYWEYIGRLYQLYTVDGTWTLSQLDNGKLDVEVTSLVDFIRGQPGI